VLQRRGCCHEGVEPDVCDESAAANPHARQPRSHTVGHAAQNAVGNAVAAQHSLSVTCELTTRNVSIKRVVLLKKTNAQGPQRAGCHCRGGVLDPAEGTRQSCFVSGVWVGVGTRVEHTGSSVLSPCARMQ